MKISEEEIKCIRRLSGEMETNQERSMFEVNLLLDESVKELYQDYKLLWECYPEPSLPLKKSQYAKRILEEIGKDTRGVRSLFAHKAKAILAIAAVFVVGLGLHLFNMEKGSRYTNHIIAAEGKRKQVVLPDGSSIILNSGSEVKYPETFSSHSREVWMTGEAYFDITRDVDRPFKVKTDELFVQVLGTKFNVNTKGKTKTVSLESGKVDVTLEASGDRIRLNPKEELLWNKETGEVIKRNFDVAKKTAWKDNILLLDNLTLKEALIPINIFYGTEFVLTDSDIAHKKVSGAFEGQDLSGFIKTLEFIANVKITPLSSNKFSISSSDEK
ncbi:FecR family protein [Abyssalbus ytuae]|uniref:FecR domain-containing protein n=1 Tax=Abyssalbus ytuae TaxID=2926907 RepID=A0A9E7D2T0_9FLAO|nr:FecR domain-containing protein [Abyssalbus ytuae]UOB17034.1 FecR domain-containing protein [Abyssalbus ytuae]